MIDYPSVTIAMRIENSVYSNYILQYKIDEMSVSL